MGQKPWREERRSVVKGMFLMVGAVCWRKCYSLGEIPGLPALRGPGLGEQGQMDLQTNPGAAGETPRLLFVYLYIYGDHTNISYILIIANTDMGLVPGPYTHPSALQGPTLSKLFTPTTTQ